VSVVAPAVIEPAPSSVQSIVPFDELAPLTVAVAFEQIVCVPPADAIGNALTVVVIPALVATQPFASVTFTVTTCPVANALVVKVAVVLAAPWLIAPTKNSYVPVPAPVPVKVTELPEHIILSASLLLMPATGGAGIALITTLQDSDEGHSEK
jgi:hypothetical protein